jgi:flavin-dependent dehydrogenase
LFIGRERAFALFEAQGSEKSEAPGHCEVLVIGGGPAGTTIAALLAERGRHVVLMEKDRHPRFHIGESLLPLNLPLFDRLGVRNEIESTAIYKYGVEFISAYHGKSVTYDFGRAWDKRFPYSFQVRRSIFDHLLLKNAAAKGAKVIEGCRVSAVDLDGNGRARVEGILSEDGGQHCFVADFLVDASGRDTFLSTRLGAKERNRQNDSAAIFGHFRAARRLLGKAEGNISIAWFDNGWIWFIPLLDGTTSVGAVCPSQFFKTRTTDLTNFFMSIIASCPEIADRLKHADLVTPVTATGNYSYYTRRTSGRNFLMVGDACAFIDPVFSTGVYLAMSTASMAAEAVDACLKRPGLSFFVLRRYDKAVRNALGSFTWFIYRIREPAMRNLFMSPRNWFRIEEAVLSLFAGDIFGRSPVRGRLLIFKIIYYITKFAHLRYRFRFWRISTPERSSG